MRVAVLVDVLSFTTTLSVALDAGVTVLPYRWDDASAGEYAQQHDAALSPGRGTARPGWVGRSPLSLRTGPAPARLVLPWPDGASIAHRLDSVAEACLGGCLRNAGAVSGWIAAQHDPAAAAVVVIAVGERWPRGGLRPAVEDLWGAGAIVAGLAAAGWSLSPEAQAARAAYLAVQDDVLAGLLGCASGRELVDNGYRSDVQIAAEVDTSEVVPLLRDRRFTPAAAARLPQ